MNTKEVSSCGVGFVASLNGDFSHSTLELGLRALVNLEHRGGTAPDLCTGDGAGIMADLPRELLGVAEGDAVANLFLPRDPTFRVRSLHIFEETFRALGLEILRFRDVPIRVDVLSPTVRSRRPEFLMAVIRRPQACSTRYSFEKMLYSAKQLTRSRLRKAGISKQFFFTSLSAGTVVYKALTRSAELAELYPDLKNPAFRTRFVLFHRRFSTNTATAWDTAQPFRVVAHNGEINTISGNRAWAYARERALGLDEDELLTHRGISDSGSVNEMIEALLFRSSIPHPEDILAILMPQADNPHSFYRFWRRAMEPWDGPALFTYSDGRTVGARLDRSGFRPCRWARTATRFFLSSEAGSFEVPEGEILSKGSLSGGRSVTISLDSGEIHFHDASQARENRHASFDPRVVPLPRHLPHRGNPADLARLSLFNYTEEDLQKVLNPLVAQGKEGIGSMGDSARLAVLSDETRSLYDFFYQRFAQVTNPPLDYLREKIVTDMSVILGRKPNIFEPKELIPLKLGIELEGPVLTLGQTEFLKGLSHESGFEGAWPATQVLDASFPRAFGLKGMLDQIELLQAQVVKGIRNKISVFIITDRSAHENSPPHSSHPFGERAHPSDEPTRHAAQGLFCRRFRGNQRNPPSGGAHCLRCRRRLPLPSAGAGESRAEDMVLEPRSRRQRRRARAEAGTRLGKRSAEGDVQDGNFRLQQLPECRALYDPGTIAGSACPFFSETRIHRRGIKHGGSRGAGSSRLLAAPSDGTQRQIRSHAQLSLSGTPA